MIPAQISIDVNEKEIKNYIQERIDEQLKVQLHFVDINKLEYMTSFSRRHLEEEFLHKPIVKMHERRKGSRGKRVWIYPHVLEAIKDVMDEW